VTAAVMGDDAISDGYIGNRAAQVGASYGLQPMQ
jgi:hypothetical protein